MRVARFLQMAGWSAALAPFLIAAPSAGADGQNEESPVRVISTLEWSGSDDLTASAFDRTGELLLTAAGGRGYRASVNPFRLDENGSFKISIRGRPPEMILWDAATGKRREVFKGHKAPVYRVAFSPDGRRVASGGAETYVPVTPLVVPPPDDTRLRFGKGGMARESGAMVKSWDRETSRELSTMIAPGKFLGPIAFSDDGRLLEAFVGDLGFLAWNVETGRFATGKYMNLFMSAGKDQPKIVDSSESRLCIDANHLKVTVEDALRITNSKQGGMIQFFPFKMEVVPPKLWSIALSPDGSRVATGDEDGTVRTWDFVTGRLLTGPEVKPDEPRGSEEDRVSLFVFNAAGDLFVSGHQNGRVQLWNTDDGRRLLEIEGPPGPVVAAQFVGGKARLLSGGSRNGRWAGYPLDHKIGRSEWKPLVVWEFDVPPM